MFIMHTAVFIRLTASKEWSYVYYAFCWINGRVMFIRLNLKDYGLVDVGIVIRKLFADVYCYYDFFMVWGTHPWSLSKHLHTSCRLCFNTSWVSCSHCAADIRQVWFVPLCWRVGERGEGVGQLCMHWLTEAKNLSVFVYFYVAATTLIVCYVYQVPLHVQLSQRYFLSCLLQQVKVKFGNSLSKSKFYSGRN